MAERIKKDKQKALKDDVEQVCRDTAIKYFGRSKPFSYEEIADYFSVCKDTVERWVREDSIRVFVRGRVVRVRVEDLYAWICRRTA